MFWFGILVTSLGVIGVLFSNPSVGVFITFIGLVFATGAYLEEK